MRLTETHTTMNEQRVVSLPRLLRDRDRSRVRQPITRTRHKLLERIIRIQRQRLFAFIENPPARKILTVKTPRDQSPGHRLRRSRERLLTLTLTKIQLCLTRNGHLDDTVGQLTRRQ